MRVEEYVYYVNKRRQNVGLETWIWRQIVTSQRPLTTNKWPPYATERNPPMKIFCVRHCHRLFIKMRAKTFLSFSCWNDSFCDCKCWVYHWTMESNLIRNPHCLLAGTDQSPYLQYKPTVQSELLSTPNALSRLKNVVFRHCDVIRKNISFIETNQQPLQRYSLRLPKCNKTT